jgi:hypothetical protein
MPCPVLFLVPSFQDLGPSIRVSVYSQPILSVGVSYKREPDAPRLARFLSRDGNSRENLAGMAALPQGCGPYDVGYRFRHGQA